jgi:hypothetical protein
MPRDEIIGPSHQNESMHAVDTAALIRRLETSLSATARK